MIENAIIPFVEFQSPLNNRPATRELSTITSRLYVKVTISEMATAITEFLLRYVDSDSIRRRRKASFYKLNRKEVMRFEAIINAI